MGFFGSIGKSISGIFGGSLDPTNVKRTAVAPAAVDQTQDFLNRARQPVQQVQGPNLGPAPFVQNANIDQSQISPLRQQNQALLGRLDAAASGQAPSVAQAQLAANTEAGLRAAQAQQASQRGVSAALANRNLQNQLAAQNQAAAQQGAVLGLQERQQNQQLLAQALQSQFGQEAGLAQQQAALQQQAGLANQNLQGTYGLQQASLGQQAALANQQAALNQLGLQGQAAQNIDQMRNQGTLTQAQLDASRQGQISQGKGNLLGAVGGVAAAAAMPAAVVSDKNMKKNVVVSEGKSLAAVEEFLKSAKPYEFNYKSDEDGQEGQLGIMAQDLEKTRIGRQMVSQNLGGYKQVDFGRGFGALMAAIGELNQKIDKRKGA
jgi:hypothetical protein